MFGVVFGELVRALQPPKYAKHAGA